MVLRVTPAEGQVIGQRRIAKIAPSFCDQPAVECGVHHAAQVGEPETPIEEAVIHLVTVAVEAKIAGLIAHRSGCLQPKTSPSGKAAVSETIDSINFATNGTPAASVAANSSQ